MTSCSWIASTGHELTVEMVKEKYRALAKVMQACAGTVRDRCKKWSQPGSTAIRSDSAGGCRSHWSLFCSLASSSSAQVLQQGSTRIYYTALYYSILYYTILYYTVPYHTIRYDTVVYYTMGMLSPHGPLQSPVARRPSRVEKTRKANYNI